MYLVIDQNGNYRTIGTTVSSPTGSFGYTWIPDIPGDYSLYASFEGSNSYWPTTAETSFYAGEPASTSTPQPTQIESMADLYFVPAIIGLFVFVAIIGLVIILVLRKRP